MRYPTHLNDIQSSLSPIVNLVNRPLDLNGNKFSASNIEFNYLNSRQLNINAPCSCTLSSAIRINNNPSTRLVKDEELFSYTSAVIKDIVPARDVVGSTIKLYNNVIQFTNPSVAIPTSVITLTGGVIQGTINTTGVINTVIQQITGVVAGVGPTWDFTVGNSSVYIVGNDVEVVNVGTPGSPPSPFNTGSVITAKVVSLPNSTTVRLAYSGTGSVNPPTGLTPIVTGSSELVQKSITITNASIILQGLIITISGGQAIPDLSGACAPALVAGTDDSLYFAFISRYTSNISYLLYKDTPYDIVLGHILTDGSFDWLHRLDGLVTAKEESTPVLVIGDQNDLYLAYMTTGATSGNINGEEIFMGTQNFGICGCPDPATCTLCGDEDIVLARINPSGASSSIPPTIVWKVQSGYINSIYNETKPSVCLDTANQLVYLAYQCNKNLACFTPVGTSNILLHCFTMTGLHLWVKAQTEINSAGANTSPSIAADNLGNVYVAYEVAAGPTSAVNVEGGASIAAGQQQIEVVRFQTVLSSPNSSNTYNPTTTYLYGTWVYYQPTGGWYQVKAASIQNDPPGSSNWSEPYPVNVFYVNRVWVLSQSLNIFAADGNGSQPSIVADRTNGFIFLAFLATGKVMNIYDYSASHHDLVFMSFTSDRVMRWIYQGGEEFNTSEITYMDCDSPNLMMDRYGNMFISLLTYLEPSGMNMAVFQYDQSGDSRWGYPRTQDERYPVYMWARTDGPNAVFPTSPFGSFSKIGIGKAYSNIFLGTISDLLAPGQIQVGAVGTNMACISRFTENIYYKDRNAFSYMLDIRSICTCGKENCGCF
jgi:hypothetical protein